jgi:hypothetical protein
MGNALNLLKHLLHRSPQRRRGEIATAWSKPAKLPPKTLYELLRVRPDDDAEMLQVAFREAVKVNHPDVNPGDPDASTRLRQIVTGYGVLRDAEQRKAYDRLLAAERAQHRARLTRTLTSDVVAIVSLSAMLIGGYALFAHVSKIPSEAASPVETAARQSIEMTAVQPPVSADTGDRGETRGKSAPAAPSLPGAVPSGAGGIEPSMKANGGPVADASVNVVNAGADRGDRSKDVAILAKSDESDLPDPSVARSTEPQPSLPKDVGAARSSPASSPRSEEKRPARTTGKPPMHAIRPVPDRAPVRQAASENRDLPPVAPEGRNARATPLFGVGF